MQKYGLDDCCQFIRLTSFTNFDQSEYRILNKEQGMLKYGLDDCCQFIRLTSSTNLIKANIEY